MTCHAAASGGQLDVLRWVRAHGATWDKRTCEMAAYNGHLEVLQWLRANDCPWEEWICANTAGQGHLEVLQWVSENDATGKVWNESAKSIVRRSAMGPRKKEVLAWLDGLSGM